MPRSERTTGSIPPVSQVPDLESRILNPESPRILKAVPRLDWRGWLAVAWVAWFGILYAQMVVEQRADKLRALWPLRGATSRGTSSPTAVPPIHGDPPGPH